MAEAAKDRMLVQLTAEELRELMLEAAREGARQAVEDLIKPPDRWIDVDAAAKHFGVSGQTIRNWIEAGAPAAKPGRDYRIQLAVFAEWVEAHRPGVRLKRVK